MNDLSTKNIKDYKRQMELGTIPTTYKGLIEYMMSLRNYFINNHPEYNIGNLYQGYMDITYFPILTPMLKSRKLKLAVVFDHYKVRFEIWLSAQNRKIRNQHINLLQHKVLNNKYSISENPDSIIETVIIENPDFSELHRITNDIEMATMKFIWDLTNVLK